jgi:carboxylate-amine ligase
VQSSGGRVVRRMYLAKRVPHDFRDVHLCQFGWAMTRAAARRLGVEEEFHLVDAATQQPVDRASELLGYLPRGVYVEELQRCVVEVNSGVFAELGDLRADLVRHRTVLVETAEALKMRVVAAGSMPRIAPVELEVTDTPRFRRMSDDYRLLVQEQLICSSQVHVDVADRDEALKVADRIGPYIPVLLALSASSPFWGDGIDTGYASMRTLVWSRWPTAGPLPSVTSAVEYDRLVADLVATEVITDPGMIYFDLRPSDRYSTLELRVCDSSPSVDTIVLIAALFRALVEREVAMLDQGAPARRVSYALVRAAMWRAARSGLEEDLIDTDTLRPRPAAQVVESLVRSLRPQLEASEDWQMVCGLVAAALREGSSAARQRRALRRRGRITDVVDLLVNETAGRIMPIMTTDHSMPVPGHGVERHRVDRKE